MSKTLRRILLLAACVLGFAAIASGYSLDQHRSNQLDAYNEAMNAMEQGDLDAATQMLDQSLTAYSEGTHAGAIEHILHGRPSDQIAAMAHFHKAVLLLVKAQREKRPGLAAQAVDQFKESLRLNPGAPYVDDIDLESVQRLDAEAMTAKHDLDLLFSNHSEQKGQGQAEPKPGDQKPAEPQQAPDGKPGNQPAPSDGDDL